MKGKFNPLPTRRGMQREQKHMQLYNVAKETKQRSCITFLSQAVKGIPCLYQKKKGIPSDSNINKT